MTYCLDLDGVICTDERGQYERCKPVEAVIQRIRRLHAEGHQIIIDTARGSSADTTPGRLTQLRTLTEQQLLTWDVPYHHLRIGLKPFADVYVDDRAKLPDETW